MCLYFTASVFLIFIHEDGKGIETAYDDSLQDLFKSQKKVKKMITKKTFISLGCRFGILSGFNDIQKRLIADFISKH